MATARRRENHPPAVEYIGEAIMPPPTPTPTPMVR